MSNVAEKITQRLVSAALIKPEDSSLYQYGLQQGLFMLLNFITTVVVGLLFGMLWQSILFSLVYMPLRMNAGGYHARTPLRCYVFSTALIFAVLSVIRLVLHNKLICGIMAAVGAAIIFALAPVEDANKPLDKIERKVYRKRACLTLAFWMMALLFGFVLAWEAVSATIATAVATMGGMVGVGNSKSFSVIGLERSITMKIKRLLSTFLAFGIITCSLIGMNTGAYASTNLRPSSSVLQITQKLLSHSVSRKPYKLTASASYALGDKIPVYELDNGKITLNNGAEYYPVYGNQKMLGIFTVNDAQSPEPTYSFGQDFALELSNITNNGLSDYFLLIDGNKLHAYVNNQFKLVKDFTCILGSRETKLSNSASMEAEKEILSNKDKLLFTNNKNLSSVSITSSPSLQRSSGTVLYIDTFNQGNTELCWAVTVWTIGKFITDNFSYTPLSVAQSQGLGAYTTGDIDDGLKAFKDCYSLDGTKRDGILTRDELEAEIDDSRPVYTAWYNDSFQYGHTVAMCGYGIDNGIYTVDIMESLYGNYRTIYQANNQYRMSYLNGNYRWWNSIRIAE